MIYFDANATCPPLAEAQHVYQEALRDHWHNPSSPHAAGARAHILLGTARQDIARLLGCTAAEIVFNSGATEGNNSLFAWLAETHRSSTGRVLLSAIEHPCVLEAARHYFPSRHTLLPVDAKGQLQLAALEKELTQGDVLLVSLMAANNETGVLQPWHETLALCRKHRVYFHSDAAQWLGKQPAQGLGDCDFVTACAHKFGGPKGVGFLKIPASLNAFNHLHGGGQENNHRSGTENYPGVAAMVAALRFREHSMTATTRSWSQQRKTFEQALKKRLPGVHILGESVARLPNTSCLILPGQPGARWVARLDKLGFATSTGSACASGKTGASHVLTAQGLSPENARCSLRVSATWDHQPAHWQELADAILKSHEAFAREADTPGHSQVITI